jgi:hypothetical protein
MAYAEFCSSRVIRKSDMKLEKATSADIASP